MRTPTYTPRSSAPWDEISISVLYQAILSAWNRRNARDFATHFTPDAYLVGFDGSQMNGASEIESELSRIFRDHPTAAYIGIIQKIRFLAPQTALLHAVAGMVPPGQADINPALNAIQTLVVAREEDHWLAAQMQTTPAQFHGRPELSEALTDQLRKWL